MELQTLLNRVQALETLAVELGFKRVETSPYLNFCGKPFAISIEMDRNNKRIRSPVLYALDCERIPETLETLRQWVLDQETPLAARERDFQRNLADLIETGREIGSPILPDLEATMKRLSENVITHS